MDYGVAITGLTNKFGLDILLRPFKLELQRHERLILQLFSNKDILLLIFEQLSIYDIRRIPLVCKRWSQITKEDAFWRMIIKKKIPEEFSDKKELFDPKYHEKNKNWIFYDYSKAYMLTREDPFFYSSYRIICGKYYFYYNDQNQLTAIIIQHDNYHIDILFMQNRRFDIKKLQYQYTNRDTISFIEYENEEGVRWNGSCKCYKNEYYQVVPHGKGTWTFPDGSIFIGDNVAFEGIPHGKGSNYVEYYFGHKINDDSERNLKRIKWC